MTKSYINTPCVLRIFAIILSCLCTFSREDVIQLTESNFQTTLDSHELVLINYYAEWCYFSQMLDPIFKETAEKVKSEIKEQNLVALGRVDCEKEKPLAEAQRIRKYPTLKLARHGTPLKREFRGQRSVEALLHFIKEQLQDPIKYVQATENLTLEPNHRYVIGHFSTKTDLGYEVFKKVAGILRESCQFVFVEGPVADTPNYVEFKDGQDGNVHRFDVKPSETSFDQLMSWASSVCVPLIRELTFSNAEEITEEGLPLVILFHLPDDTTSTALFRDAIKRDMHKEKGTVNFLVADGRQFSHPLHHLGKTERDLPIICIDSFQHMYLFNHNVHEGLQKEGLLRQFVGDLHSGKLHREFHHGPDPTPPQISEGEQEKTEGDTAGHVPRDSEQHEQASGGGEGTTPPPSIFKKLAPSRTRYTILHDEF